MFQIFVQTVPTCRVQMLFCWRGREENLGSEMKVSWSTVKMCPSRTRTQERVLKCEVNFFLYFSVITPLTQSMSSMHCNGGTLSDTINITVLYWFQWMTECDWFNDSLLWHWPQNRRWQHWSQYVKVSLPHFWLISVHFTHNAFHTSHICQILRPAMHISHSRWTSFQLLRQMGWNRWK